MATRATQDFKNATIKSFIVAAGQTATAGRAQKMGADDITVTPAGSGEQELARAVALETQTAGKRVQCVLIDASGAVCPMIVGTGGTTRGLRQKLVADGITDVTASTDKSIGTAAQSGVVGDLVGVDLGKA